MANQRQITALLLGAAVGDAIGLPREGMSACRAERFFGPPPLRHRFFFGKGMISDDTEHLCMVGQALLASHGDPDRFARSLAWRLRGWLLGMPAGIGWATLRAILRLWIGLPPHRSGVTSAGNGPMMRAGLLGLYAQDDEHMAELVRRSTRMTHTDPRAQDAAMVVALASRMSAEDHVDLHQFVQRLAPLLATDVVKDLIRDTVDAIRSGIELSTFVKPFQHRGGVSGYVVHALPACVFCWLRFAGDYRGGVEAVIGLGGDTDSHAAVVGGLLGIAAGEAAIPTAWRDRLTDCPRSRAWLRRLAERIAADGVTRDQSPVPLAWPLLLPRNVAFAFIVILHGLRRLLPPY